MTKFNPVKAILFDMDGLLLNTEPVYEGAFRELCLQYGSALTPEVRVKLLGSTELRACEACVNGLSLNVTLDEFVSEFRRITLERLEHVDFLPGVVRLIQHLNKHNIPIAVATSSSAESVEVKTKHHKDVFKLFKNITKGTEVKEGKPAPDIFLLAASRIEPKIEPHECLVMEDAPNGVQAAISAGMQVVMVPADYITDEQKSKATLAIKSMEEFKPEMFGLPAFD